MAFNKASINGRAYGDPVDRHGNPIDITEVSSALLRRNRNQIVIETNTDI